MRVLQRVFATDSDEPDAGTGMNDGMERAKGIEPSYAAWEAAVLPLNYARKSLPGLINLIFADWCGAVLARV